MLTRSTRALPPDFNPNQPVGRRIKLNPIQERAKILANHPTLPAAFPTLDRPPSPPERKFWVRGASAAVDDGPKNKRRRIDMTEDDLLNELHGDNEFLDAQIGCKEAELPLFGQGDYKQVFVPNYNEDNKIDLGLPVLDDLNPGEYGLALFYDEESSENWGLDVPATCAFKGLANGVKMAIVIEATELHKVNAKVCAALMLNDDDIDDYIQLYEREAENDANHAYNIQMEEEWEMMHRIAGRTDFENYYPPDRKPTFRSALSLIKQKDVDAGQRYLNMVGQSRLVSKLEDYVGCAGANTFSFKHAQVSARRTSSNYAAPESIADSEMGGNHSLACADEEDVIRDGRRGQTSNGSSVMSHREAPVVHHKPMAPPPPPVIFNATEMPAAQPVDQPAAQPVAATPDHVANSPKNNLDGIPLLAQPPKRRRLMQGRPAEMKPSPVPSYAVVEDQQPGGASSQRGHGIMPAPEKPDTPPPEDLELALEMSTTTRRTPSRPDDEPEFARNITSSPVRRAFAEPRRPRVAHLERKGQNPSRHSSGTGSPIVHTDLKLKRQLSGVYRPERQWAEQPPSSSPLRATTPRPVTPRTGSKQYFLSEQSPAHPPSSPRVFDESGKTVRERLPSPEEVAKIFKIQEQEARKQRQVQFEQAKPGESPILPSSTTASGYQAPFSSQKASTQQPPILPPTMQTTPIRPQPILPPPTATTGTYQPMFANLIKSKQPATPVAASPAPARARQTTPILPPPRRTSFNNLAPYTAHNIADVRSSQVGGAITTFTTANDQSQQTIPQGASVGGSHATIPLSQTPVPQAASQQQVWTQGQHPVQQQATGHPPQIGPPKKAPAPRQKVRRSKTTADPQQAGSVPIAKSESGDKARGKPLKSTFKPPPQAQQTERPLYKPNYARADSGSNASGSLPTPQPMPATPQQSNLREQYNALKRSHSMLPGMGMGNNTLMAGPQPANPQPGGISFYNNSFSAHSKATFDRTVQEFARDPPRQNYNNQHTKNREANPLQAPQDFSAPRRGPKSTTSNGSGEAPTHPNPFRDGRTGSQAPPAGVPAQRPAVESHAAQYHGHQPQQPQQNRLQQPFQPPAKKQKVSHPEPVGTPERPLWDRKNRNQSSPAQPPPMMAAIPQTPAMGQNNNPSPMQRPQMMGAVPQTPLMSSSSGDTTSKPNMPNGCMSGLMGVPTSEHFAQAMKNHGVQLPGQLAQQASMKKKRNVGAKVQSSPSQASQTQLPPSQAPPPQGAMMMGPIESGMAAAASQAQGPPQTPKKGPGRPRGVGTKRQSSAKKKVEVDSKQTSMESFLGPSQKPSGGGGGMI